MANVTSGSYVFDKNLGIDEIIEDAYERIGMQGVSGYQLKTAKRSLNILFSEWGNRGLQFWEVKNQNVTLVSGQAVYTFFRSTADGVSNGVSTTLSAGINAAVTTIPLTSILGFPTAGNIIIGTEDITYTGISSLNLTGCTRGTSAPYRGVSPTPTTANSHSTGVKVYGAYKVQSLNTTQVEGTGQPQFTTRFDGVDITITSNATSTETGGGFQCTIGPVNDRD